MLHHIESIIRKGRDLVSRGQELSIKVKKNILLSMVVRGISIVTSFLLVPLTLGYVGKTEYGLWLTISSIIGWLGYFDIGMGNGLRNKLTEALSTHATKEARGYLSTAYVSLGIIFGGLIIIFLVVNPFINWDNLLNAEGDLSSSLSLVVSVVMISFLLQFALKNINTLLIADQRPAISNSFLPVANIIILIIIFLLVHTTEGSLLKLCLVLSVIPLIVLGGATFYFFTRDYRHISPSFKFADMKYFRDITGLGFKFLIIQLAVLVIFSTDNFIITRILGPAEVTPYNIAYKYFSLVTMIFGIILQPIWSAYTHAYTRNNVGWIKGVTKKMITIWSGMFFLVLLMILFANRFYHFWVGDLIKIPLLLSIGMALFVLISTWNNIFVNLINATGKIKFQLYSSIVIAAVNIPLSIYFARNLHLGPSGVILATCVSLFPGVIINPFQYYLIVHNKARGIWNQ